MTVRSLELPQRALSGKPLMPPEATLATQMPPPKPLPHSAVELPAAPESHADAVAPELSYPDAALPGGRTRAKVVLSVASDGFVGSLAVEPNVLPEAFEKAIERAFEGSLLSFEQRGGQLRAGRLCIEVQFREGEAPTWQRIAPTGICAS